MEHTLGTEHPNVSKVYSCIGQIYLTQKKYDPALEMFNKVLNISTKAFGKEHSEVANSYNFLGQIYYLQGEYYKSREYYKKALAIAEKLDKKFSFFTAQLSFSIGANYLILNDSTANSKIYFDKGLKIMEENAKFNGYATMLQIAINYYQYANAPNELEQYKAKFDTLMEHIVYTAEVISHETSTPIKELNGKYYILQYGKWDLNNKQDLISFNFATKEKIETVILWKKGKIFIINRDEIPLFKLASEAISPQEKQRMAKQYTKWKVKNSQISPSF